MVYYELAPDGKTKMLCRTENFLPYHEGLKDILLGDPLRSVLRSLLQDDPVLFKEKINYKLAGGGAFPAHQDAPAFKTFGQQSHLSVAIAIDQSTKLNGCLEVAPGFHSQGLIPQDPSHGGLSKEEEQKIGNWMDVLMEPGDVLIFSSWLPHRSQKNLSNSSRRALYVTYNGKRDGDFREKYYVAKKEHFPQEVDRIPGQDYSEGAKTYNLATPIVS